MKINLIDILIVILFILSVYFILTRIFGHSASDLTISVTLFIFLGSLIFKLMYIIFDIDKELSEFRVRTIYSFNNIKENMNLIKNKLKISG